MDQQRIIDALETNNKWWKSELILDFKPREVYKEIKKFLHTRQIISLTGLRRVGKTTIMLKIVQDLISKLGNENILYFSFDDFREVKVIDIIRSYSRLMNKDTNNGN